MVIRERGLGYIEECSTPSSKTIFVKASSIVPNMPNVVSNNAKSSFVSICHIIVVLKVILDLSALY